MSTRGIRRTFGVCYQTLMKWVGEKSGRSPGVRGHALARPKRRRALWLAYDEVFPSRTHRFCGKEEGETNHAERFFGTLRSRLSRLVRKTYSFSKRIERHLEAIHFFITSYNLQIRQATKG